MEKIVIHHISLSKTSLNLSGGEKAEIEIVDFLDKKGLKNIIYTSESGEILYKKLKDFSNVDFVKIGPFKYEKINSYVAYYLRFFQLFFHLKKFKNNYNHIILSHDIFVPSILYSFFLKLINPKSKWLCIYHTKSPRFFKGFLGEFTNKFNFPNPRLIRFWINERIAFLLTKSVNNIITVNPYYLEYLSRFYPKDKIYCLKYFGGQEDNEKYKKSYEKQYDVIFMGRFQPLKGFFDLIEIIKNCKKGVPNIKLVVLGGGNKNYEDRFTVLIKQNDLGKNIIYKGYISGNEKYKYIQESKLFLMPSYYESYGLVILEAFQFGLPVVSYDLPVYSIFGDNLIKSNIGDTKKIADLIVNYLNNESKYNDASRKVLEFSKQFSWVKTGKEVYDLIFDIIQQ